MVGLFRYYLACMVLLHHFWTNKFDYTGRYAVFGFYVIAGFFSALVLNEVYTKNLKGRVTYLWNRALRIYPLYWSVIVVTIMMLLLIPETKDMIYKAIRLPSNGLELFKNIFIFGLDNHEQCRLIPPAWSLNVILTFYMLMALGLCYNKKVALFWFMLSLLFTFYMIVFSYSWNQRYFTIFAASLPFSFGSFLYYYKDCFVIKKHTYLFLNVCLVIFAIVTLTFFSKKIFIDKGTVPFYLFMFLCGYQLILLMSLNKINISRVLRKVDSFAGYVSYSLFLCHPLVGRLLLRFDEFNIDGKGLKLVLISLVSTTVFAYVMHFLIERKINTKRSLVKKQLAIEAT